jgi:hypothetical protein
VHDLGSGGFEPAGGVCSVDWFLHGNLPRVNLRLEARSLSGRLLGRRDKALQEESVLLLKCCAAVRIPISGRATARQAAQYM